MRQATLETQGIGGRHGGTERHGGGESSERFVRAADDGEGGVIDEFAVNEILELQLGDDRGDPIRGIRNGLIAAAAVWAALAVAWRFLS